MIWKGQVKGSWSAGWHSSFPLNFNGHEVRRGGSQLASKSLAVTASQNVDGTPIDLLFVFSPPEIGPRQSEPTGLDQAASADTQIERMIVSFHHHSWYVIGRRASTLTFYRDVSRPMPVYKPHTAGYLAMIYIKTIISSGSKTATKQSDSSTLSVFLKIFVGGDGHLKNKGLQCLWLFGKVVTQVRMHVSLLWQGIFYSVNRKVPHKRTNPTIDTFPVKSSQVKSKVYKSRRTQYHTAVSSRSTVWVAEDSYSLSLFLSHCAKPRLTFSTKKKGRFLQCCVYTHLYVLCARTVKGFSPYSQLMPGKARPCRPAVLLGHFPFSFLSFFAISTSHYCIHQTE